MTQNVSAKERTSFDRLNATRVTVTILGVIFGLSGATHGLFEFLQGNKPTGTFFIHAIGEAQRFWPKGTEDAFTLLPTFRLTGLMAMLVGLIIVVWSLFFIETRYGRTVFISLFIILLLVGGGVGQVAHFIPAWAFATRMNTPLNWWKKVLPRSSWPFLSKLWIVIFAISMIMLLFGVEAAIFGIVPGTTDPDKIQNTALFLVFGSAILNIFVFIAGFAHDLRRMELTS